MKADSVWFCYSGHLGYNWLPVWTDCLKRGRGTGRVVRQAALLRDADGQLRGHLSDWMVEDGGGESLVARGGNVASCRIFMGSYKGIVCICVFAHLCVRGFVSTTPYKLLSEAQRLDVTLPPWLWWRCGCRMRERKWWVEIRLPSGGFASENSECGWQNRLTFAFDRSLRQPCFWEICTVWAEEGKSALGS